MNWSGKKLHHQWADSYESYRIKKYSLPKQKCHNFLRYQHLLEDAVLCSSGTQRGYKWSTHCMDAYFIKIKAKAAVKSHGQNLLSHKISPVTVTTTKLCILSNTMNAISSEATQEGLCLLKASFSWDNCRWLC